VTVLSDEQLVANLIQLSPIEQVIECEVNRTH